MSFLTKEQASTVAELFAFGNHIPQMTLPSPHSTIIFIHVIRATTGCITIQRGDKSGKHVGLISETHQSLADFRTFYNL